MAEDTTGLPEAGWYADPRVPFQLRFWDGAAWTNNVHMPDRTGDAAVEPALPLAPQWDRVR